MIIFIDDILIYLESEEHHVEHLRIILQTLGEHHLFRKFYKCEFWLLEVCFLDHVISSKGIQVDPSNVEAILS